MKKKITLLSWIFLLIFFGISIRAVSLSIKGLTDSPDHKDIKKIQKQNLEDRNGNIIATTVCFYDFYINLAHIAFPEKVIQKLKQVIPEIENTNVLESIRTRVAQDKSGWVLIQKNITKEKKMEIIKAGIDGAKFPEVYARYYPYDFLFSHIVGRTNVDYQAQSGLERFFENELLTKPVKTTLDARVQNILRNSLAEKILKTDSIGGFGIVSDITNGEVLATVSLPDFNPNEKIEITQKMQDKVISSLYNLGSVMKIITVAMALESGIKKTDFFDTSSSVYVDKTFSITDEHFSHASLNMSQIIAYSSNVGTARILEKIGFEKQKNYYTQMKVFDPVQTDLKSVEVAKPIYPKGKWQASSHYTMAYGYGISLSPLHFVKIANGLINNGVLFEPTFLLKESDSKNTPKWQIISSESSKSLTEILRDVVEFGTAKRATVNGYTVCGKTGTSQKYHHRLKKWDNTKKIVSFYGFFPCTNPKYSIYIGLDEPKKSEAGLVQGGTIAAPVVSTIIEQIGPILNVEQDVEFDDIEKIINNNS